MSPPATTSLEEDRLALQRAADELFYKHGVGGVTVSAIRDKSGVSLRRIYEICPSKAELVSLWLGYRHETWTRDFAARVERRLAEGRRPVDAIFDSLADWMVATNFRGCGFINTRAELNELTDDHVRIIQDHKHTFASYLDDVVGAGPELAVLVDGAIVQASMFSSTEPISLARATAHALLAINPSKARPHD